MAEIEIVVYISVFLLGMFFSLLTLTMKHLVASILSWITWFALAGWHVAFLYSSVFLGLSYFYGGLGFTFLFYTFGLAYLQIRGKPDKDLEL